MKYLALITAILAMLATWFPYAGFFAAGIVLVITGDLWRRHELRVEKKEAMQEHRISKYKGD